MWSYYGQELEYPVKTHQSGLETTNHLTCPTPGIKPGSQWWETRRLITEPARQLKQLPTIQKIQWILTRVTIRPSYSSTCCLQPSQHAPLSTVNRRALSTTEALDRLSGTRQPVDNQLKILEDSSRMITDSHFDCRLLLRISSATNATPDERGSIVLQ